MQQPGQAASSLAFTAPRRPSPPIRLLRIVRANPLGAFGGALIAVLLLVGLFAPVLAPYKINEFAGKPAMGPARAHPFGTDKFGQDVLSRVINGARISLQVGFLAVFAGTLAGLTVGVTCGYKGG